MQLQCRRHCWSMTDHIPISYFLFFILLCRIIFAWPAVMQQNRDSFRRSKRKSAFEPAKKLDVTKKESSFPCHFPERPAGGTSSHNWATWSTLSQPSGGKKSIKRFKLCWAFKRAFRNQPMCSQVHDVSTQPLWRKPHRDKRQRTADSVKAAPGRGILLRVAN